MHKGKLYRKQEISKSSNQMSTIKECLVADFADMRPLANVPAYVNGKITAATETFPTSATCFPVLDSTVCLLVANQMLLLLELTPTN